MRIKDKIAILFIIFIVVLFGIIIDMPIGKAVIPGTDIETLNNLASVASRYKESFMAIDHSNLKGQQISGGVEQIEINYRSGICAYHNQSNLAGEDTVLYTITNVLDFRFDNNGIQLYIDGNSVNVNDYTGVLAKALYKAHINLNDYDESQKYSQYKSDIRAGFRDAIKDKGYDVDSRFWANSNSKLDRLY